MSSSAGPGQGHTLLKEELHFWFFLKFKNVVGAEAKCNIDFFYIGKFYPLVLAHMANIFCSSPDKAKLLPPMACCLTPWPRMIVSNNLTQVLHRHPLRHLTVVSMGNPHFGPWHLQGIFVKEKAPFLPFLFSSHICENAANRALCVRYCGNIAAPFTASFFPYLKNAAIFHEVSSLICSVFAARKKIFKKASQTPKSGLRDMAGFMLARMAPNLSPSLLFLGLVRHSGED